MKLLKGILLFLLVFLTGRVSGREINMSLDADVFDGAGTVNCYRMGDANRSRLKETGLTKTQLNTWLNTSECRTAIGNLGKQKIALLLNDNTILQGTKSQAVTKLIDYLNIEANYDLIFR